MRGVGDAGCAAGGVGCDQVIFENDSSWVEFKVEFKAESKGDVGAS